jgi:preprotein translocase subunit SecG
MIILTLTLLLIFLCIAIVMLILIQRTSGGMGSALGGGAADQVLGAGSAAQLTKLTVWSILGFFILSFSLYALYQSEAGERAAPIRAGTTELTTDPDSSPPSDSAIPSPDLNDATQALPPTPAQEVVPQPPVEAVDDQPQPIQEQEPQAPLQLAPSSPEANSSP